MSRQAIFQFSTLCCVALLAGCYDNNQTQSNNTNNLNTEQANDTEQDQPHLHGDADKLVWAKSDIEQDGYLITLGHHGEHFHSGNKIEPAIMIKKDGADIGDAVVYNSMIAEDKETVLAESAKTVFEPETDTEPAHYAQAEMVIPKGTKKFIIRFQVELPGVEESKSFEIDVATAH